MNTDRFRWLRYGVLALVSFPWIFVPFWLLLVNSFKTQGEAGALSLGLPQQWNIVENYTAVIQTGGYLTGLQNSLIIAIPTILVTLLLGALAAWAYARSTSWTLQFAFYICSLSILLPPAVVPTVYLLKTLGLNGTTFGYALSVIGVRLGLIIFLTTGFVKAIPKDLEEAAVIDGATRWQTFWSIILPLLGPILFTGAVVLMVSVWNDFFFAMFLLQGPERATLPLTLYRFAAASAYTLRWNLVFAHVVLTSLPLIIVYFFMQKRVVAGLTDGSVKG